SQGDWSISADGKTRTLVAKNPDGTVAWTRVTEILTLNETTFTYRVVPNAANPNVYYDIVHTKVNHMEP
ncbi:DUF4822 domain-containing protein, partial [Chryseobacterium polytrichastri]